MLFLHLADLFYAQTITLSTNYKKKNKKSCLTNARLALEPKLTAAVRQNNHLLPFCIMASSERGMQAH